MQTAQWPDDGPAARSRGSNALLVAAIAFVALILALLAVHS